MKITFYSLDDEKNKIFFKSEGKKIDNCIIFEDKSYDNTVIKLELYSSSIILNREGNVNMKLILKKNEASECFYQNEMGLEFKFMAFCKDLIIKENRIDIEYDMILDEDILSSHKIWIKIA